MHRRYYSLLLAASTLVTLLVSIPTLKAQTQPSPAASPAQPAPSPVIIDVPTQLSPYMPGNPTERCTPDPYNGTGTTGTVSLCSGEQLARSLYHGVLNLNLVWVRFDAIASPTSSPKILTSDFDVSNSGTVYVVATDSRIYRSTSSGLALFGGRGATAKTIEATVDHVWITNASNDIYRWTNATSSWEQISGKAIDISIAPDDGTVYAIGENNGLLKWDGNAFVPMDGSAVRIAAGINGTLWAVNSSNDVYEWNGSSWTQHSIKATDVSTSPFSRSAYLLGTDGKLHYWSGIALHAVSLDTQIKRISYSQQRGDRAGMIVAIDSNQSLVALKERLAFNPNSPTALVR